MLWLVKLKLAMEKKSKNELSFDNSNSLKNLTCSHCKNSIKMYNAVFIIKKSIK